MDSFLVKLEFSVYGKDIVYDYRFYFSILTVFSRVFEMIWEELLCKYEPI